MMENRFTWIPIYKELANSLLQYRDNRKELVEWIYSDLGEIKTSSRQSCVSYLKDVEKQKVKDIDPFSVFAIFNRGITNEKRIEILSCFKRWFKLKSELPTEFDGVPVVNNMHSFFFTWDRNFSKVNDELWSLFEHAVTDLDIKEPLDKALHYERPFVMLTMGLYWINPEEFLSLDSRNVSLLENYRFPADHKGWSAEDYLQTTQEMKRSLGSEALPFHSFPAISYNAWIHSINRQQDIRDNSGVSTYRKYDEITTLLKANRNLILTGAPGTGKTYMAKAIAEAMGADVGFVQFHPSYDYTDFVEGLRPCQGEAGQVGFERRDGVFKAFCKRAFLSNVATEEVAKDLNSSPTIWKVSLGGAGDNSVRSDCMENGVIRIGWEEYGDVPDFNEFEEFSRGGKTILRAFQSAMQVGDIVLSCYSEKEIDAIGVVTGNYEYRKEGGRYPRYRSVKWLVKGIKENIVEQNYGKVMTQSSVYKLGISLESVMKILQTYAPTKESTTSKQRFVFIIDEINRGNISKIFGELFFSIEPGYRGERGRVSTQYQNMVEEGDVFKEGFYVPDNVYIIGTMNDIDRSVDSMDFAMRRRFAWREVTAEESMQMLDGHADADELKARMQSLNRKIELMPELGWQYQIGAAYFLKYEQYMDFEQLWDYHLKGLLFEYLRGERRADEKLEELHNAYCLKTDTTDVDN